jgi:hypothetical protein
VFFELGLFMGWLGEPDRAESVPSLDRPRQDRLPRVEPELTATAITEALAATCNKIQRQIGSFGRRTDVTGNVVPMRQAFR